MTRSCWYQGPGYPVSAQALIPTPHAGGAGMDARPPNLPSGGLGNEAISGVAWCTAVLEIRSLQPSDPVLVHGRELGAQIELVEERCVVAEDRPLDWTVGRAERGETTFLLHILGDLQSAERLDLPLGRAVPH